MSITTSSRAPVIHERLLDLCPSLLYVYDLQERRNVYANREIASLLGFSAVEIQDMGTDLFVRLMHEEDLQRLPEHHRRLLNAADREVHEFEYRMRHRDGTWRWLISRDVVFARGPAGEVVHYLGVVEDVTARQHALDWAQRTLEMIPLLVYVFDIKEQRNFYANGQLGAMLGYSQAEVQSLGDRFLPSVMHPDDFVVLPAMQAAIKQAQDGDRLQYEYRMRRQDGTWAWLQDNVRVFLRDQDSSVRQYLGAVLDISERKQMEQEQADQRQTLIELSTPVIPVANDILVMPLIGAIDSARAQMIMDTLLNGVSERKARTMIVDITGVPIVDTQVANTLVRAAHAARLLGADVVLTGIRPEVAQTLVGLGTTLEGLVTYATLQAAIATVLASRVGA